MNFVLETIVFIFRVIYSLLEALLRWFTPTKYKSVRGEVCLVTGAGSGIGRLLALEFAKRGSKLILWDINTEGNNETKKMIEDIGEKAFADTCDLSDREEVYKAAERAKTEFGDVTILVNNAGVVFGKRLMDLKDSQIETTMKVNALAHFWTYKAFLPSMLENNHGHIVNIASALGLFASDGCPDYVASKFAAFGFSMAMKYDIDQQRKHGVVSTVVCPYLIHTGMFTGVNIRFPSLIPGMKPEDTANTIMHAVLTERDMVATPRSMYLFYHLATLLPIKTSKIVYKFMGVYDSFSGFTPTRNYQMAN